MSVIFVCAVRVVVDVHAVNVASIVIVVLVDLLATTAAVLVVLFVVVHIIVRARLLFVVVVLCMCWWPLLFWSFLCVVDGLVVVWFGEGALV